MAIQARPRVAASAAVPSGDTGSYGYAKLAASLAGDAVLGMAGRDTVTVIPATAEECRNQPPVADDQNLTTPEDTPLPITLTATDPDGTAPNKTLTYSLSGSDAGAFNIDGTSGEVTLNASANYEAKSSYAINVIATDAGAGTLGDTKAVTINVTEPNKDAWVQRVPAKDEKPEDKARLDKDHKEGLAKRAEKLKSEQAMGKWTVVVKKWSIEALLKKRSELFADKKSEEKKDKKSKETFFTTEEKKKKEVPVAFKELQKEVDAKLMPLVSKTPLLRGYLSSTFSLTNGQYPHLLKF